MSQSKEWSRRQVLGGGLGLVVVTATGVRLLLNRAPSNPAFENLRHAILSMVDRSGLTLEAGAIDRFLADYRQHEEDLTWPEDLRPATRFLLSTDFFDHGADTDRTVKYVAFYDPYLAPCRLPRRS